jgi:cytoskeletal protein CcmA (bactofilin family)
MKKQAQGNIGRTTRIVGRVAGEGDLSIEGSIHGELSITGHAHVASGGDVQAPVQANDVTIDGNVRGDVKASGAVSIGATGALIGAITCDRITIEDGAKYAGTIEMDVELPSELA